MNRRFSLDKQGILSPAGSFLTPSPSPSIPASPRLQPSPSQSPFQSDVIVVTNNPTQDTERKVSTPIRRQSFNQIGSPNTSAVVFRPSPTQSPAAASTVVGVVGNEFNTTLVGSNNISLNKKGGKRAAIAYNQHGNGSAAASNCSKSSSSSSSSSKKTVGSGQATNVNTITNSSALRSPPPPAMTQQVQSVSSTIQQFPIMNASGNQLVQIIQGSALIAQQQRPNIVQSNQLSTQQNQTSNQYVPISSGTTTPSKQNKLPQQILPKPSTLNTSSVGQTTNTAGKSVITQSKNSIPVSITMAAQSQTTLSQQSQHHLNTAVSMQSAQSQPQLNAGTPIQSAQGQQQQHTPQAHQHNPSLITTTAQQPPQQASPIILPGNLNHPLLLNQMPVILQQNAPQGVQLILRPPTPQIAVIHNSRPQIQAQQQPQQLLRIVNANGQMQLATATPTFIVSSQSNLIQQNLQGIKAQSTNPLNQLQGLTSQNPQQLAAAINSQLIGRSMAQIQNLQLANGNLAQIQMPNGLNGQFISQLPAQFQQNVTGFNQFNQLSSTNFQQLATSATGTAFQSPPPQQTSTNDMVVAAPNIQFTTQQTPINVSVAQSIPSSQIIAVPSQQQLIPTTIPTPEPMRNPTPITILPNNATVIVPDSPKTQVLPQIIQTQPVPTMSAVATSTTDNIVTTATTKKAAKKPKKPKAKKESAAVQPSMVTTTTATTATIAQTSSITQAQNQLKSMQSSAPNQGLPNQTAITTQPNQSQSQLPSLTTSTGKLDLGNVMKLCGIMDDDDFMETDETHTTTSSLYDIPTSINSSATNDIMVTIPYVQNSDAPYSFISSVDCGNTVTTTYSDPMAHSAIAKSNAGPTVASNIGDNKVIQDRQYMIKIDNNDGTPPFPLSITLPHNLGPPDNNESNKINGISNAPPPISVASYTQNNQVTAPTLQSQINKIQNQLIGAQNNLPNATNLCSSSGTAITSNANLSTLATTTTTTTTTTQKATKKKQSNKRNGKKVEPTINVPSQIGNIQISQIDRSKTPQNQSGKATTIENQIQITPIIDSMKSASASNASQNAILTMAPQQAQTMNSMANNQAIAMNLQPNQQILNIPNNVQIISSSASNLNTPHPNIITNSISAIHGNGAAGGVLINTGQPIHSQIGLQRQPTIQSSNVQTLSNQGNLMNSNAQMAQQTQAVANRQIQMTMQASPNFQMQMLPSSMQTDPTQITSLPQLTGSLTLSISEDGRLFLKHNANAPQDSHSQTILQAILSGALCNVTLINETSPPTPQPTIQPSNILDGNKQSIIVKANDLTGIQNITQQKPNNMSNVMNAQVTDKQVMITQHASQKAQQPFTNMVHPMQNQQQAQIQINCQPSSQSNTMIYQPQTSTNNMQILSSGIQTMPSPQITQQTTNTDQIMQMQPLPSVNSSQPLTKDPNVTQPPLVMNNVNAPKLIELPKTAPNQQLFSLNTITNQITQLPPGLTTASLGPMERLLIVPAGVNKQQLAKCLIQGQIHFDNIGQATQLPDHYSKGGIRKNMADGSGVNQPSNDAKTNTQLQMTHQPIIQQQRQVQVQSNQMNPSPTQNLSTQPKQVPAPKIIETQNKAKAETKAKRAKSRKSKAETNKLNKEMAAAAAKSAEIAKKDNESIKIVTTSMNTLNEVSPMQTASNEMQNKAIKSPKICNPVQMAPQQNFIANQTNVMTNMSNANSLSSNNEQSKTSLVSAPKFTAQTTPQQTPQPVIIDSSKPNNMQQKNLTITVNTSNMPPLISVNQAQMVSPTHVPRVQTIQLTPQKQQSLKTVQMQIQTLSSRLQNKNLLASIRPDLSPTNPLHNKPLPVLSNLNAMNDIEIYQALQRLFIEQQKILATGKIISTLPAAPNFSTNISNSPAPNILVPTQPVMSPVKKTVTVDKPVCNPIISTASNLPINKLKATYSSRSTQNLQPVCIVSPQQQQKVPTTLSKCDVTTSTVISTPIVSTAVSTSKETVKLPSPKLADPIPKVQSTVSTSTVPTSSTLSSCPTTTQATIATVRPPSPVIQKPLVPRTYLFENQMAIDQNSCNHPDYQSPFQNKEDAVKRLIRYHCMYTENEPENENQSEEEERFVTAAVELNNKYNVIRNKYQRLLMKESMRTVRTSELMMLDRMIVSDIQEEISSIQTDLKNINEKMAAVPPQTEYLPKENCAIQESGKLSVDMIGFDENTDRSNQLNDIKENHFDHIECDEKPLPGMLNKKPHFESQVAQSPIDHLDELIKNEVKGEPDLIPTTVSEFNNSRSICKSQINNANNNSIGLPPQLQASDMDIKPPFHQLSNKENALSQLDLNFSYDSHLLGMPKRNQTTFDVKKELENLDIESEMPSYIIKKCDQTNRNDVNVHSPLSSSDFDYLCSPGDSNTNHATSNRKKDELISCDKEPYDEWLCIQKELNLISDKRSNEHLNIDGFMESTLRNFNDNDDEACSSSKLNVDNQFSDLFNQPTNDSHHLDDEKTDIDNHLPLSELFNDTIVNNDDDHGSSADKSVENRLENMFNDNGDFDKTNDLVESRLEELFHGSTSPPHSMNASVDNQSFHMENHSEFLIGHQQQSTGQNKRHWPNNGDVLPQINMNQLHPSKRSCMMTSYIDTTNSADDNQWIMDCQQSSSYDFMTTDNHIDADQRSKFSYGTTTHNWNMRTTNDKCDDGSLRSMGYRRDTNGIEGLSSAQWEMRLASGKCDSPLHKCDSSLDKCDSRLNSISVKNSDLERDLLGLSTHSSPSALDSANSVLMHLQQNHDSVYQTSSLTGGNGNDGNSESNSANNNMAPSFDDDINQHVQNAIDSILNLQNSESESLHYLDQTMSSLLADSPLTPNLMHQPNSSGNDFHYVSQPQPTHQNSQHSSFMS